jgi:hypothetical protein
MQVRTVPKIFPGKTRGLIRFEITLESIRHLWGNRLNNNQCTRCSTVEGFLPSKSRHRLNSVVNVVTLESGGNFLARKYKPKACRWIRALLGNSAIIMRWGNE